MTKFKIINIIFEKMRMCSEEYWSKFECKNKQDDVLFKVIPVFQDIVENLQVFNIEEFSLLLRYKECVVLYNEKQKKYLMKSSRNKEENECVLCNIYYMHAINKHIIKIHSSLIDTGIMFLGPSGIGKTTQAELWQKYRSSLIINGDIVFVQETESGFLGWGTPWHGSSPYCENTSVPLKAMVVLKQAEQNSIRELTGFEKVTEVSNSVFYPQWLENGMELCLETLDHLLTSIPVYELRCRPDEDAVRLTEQTVF